MNPAELATLLTTLRAVYQFHQAHHWQSQGQSYYGDHLLFQRLYEGILPEIDAVAERVVGFGGPVLVDAVQQSVMTTEALKRFDSLEKVALRSMRPEDARVAASLEAEYALLDAIDNILSKKASQGVQNLLQGIADKHEGHTYLLQRRLEGIK